MSALRLQQMLRLYSLPLVMTASKILWRPSRDICLAGAAAAPCACAHLPALGRRGVGAVQQHPRRPRHRQPVVTLRHATRSFVQSGQVSLIAAAQASLLSAPCSRRCTRSWRTHISGPTRQVLPSCNPATSLRSLAEESQGTVLPLPCQLGGVWTLEGVDGIRNGTSLLL